MAMKISKATLRNFKQFKEVTFNLDGNVVIAGPNNCGKTTLLQAIAAWSLALECWRELNNYHRRGGGYSRAPIARQTFYPVPLRAFDLLWNERDVRGTVLNLQYVRLLILQSNRQNRIGTDENRTHIS